eukprot:jgi/Botrbrau1/10140/Bobra.0191s0011.1
MTLAFTEKGIIPGPGLGSRALGRADSVYCFGFATPAMGMFLLPTPFFHRPSIGLLGSSCVAWLSVCRDRASSVSVRVLLTWLPVLTCSVSFRYHPPQDIPCLPSSFPPNGFFMPRPGLCCFWSAADWGKSLGFGWGCAACSKGPERLEEERGQGRGGSRVRKRALLLPA